MQKQLGIYNQKPIKFVFKCINFGCNINEAKIYGFNGEEIMHLQDVKNFLDCNRVVFSFSLFFTLLLFPFTKINKKLLLFLLSVFIFLTMFISINFNFIFGIFHKIFFKQNYEFPSSYLLVKLFPQKFFVSTFIFSSLLSIAVLLCFLWQRKFHQISYGKPNHH